MFVVVIAAGQQQALDRYPPSRHDMDRRPHLSHAALAQPVGESVSGTKYRTSDQFQKRGRTLPQPDRRLANPDILPMFPELYAPGGNHFGAPMPRIRGRVSTGSASLAPLANIAVTISIEQEAERASDGLIGQPRASATRLPVLKQLPWSLLRHERRRERDAGTDAHFTPARNALVVRATGGAVRADLTELGQGAVAIRSAGAERATGRAACSSRAGGTTLSGGASVGRVRNALTRDRIPVRVGLAQLGLDAAGRTAPARRRGVRRATHEKRRSRENWRPRRRETAALLPRFS